MIVLVCGPSGSGKSFFCQKLLQQAKNKGLTATYICHDDYYKDLSHLPIESRHLHNFDHPDSLDTSQLIKDLETLTSGTNNTVKVFDYDYNLHCKKNTFKTLKQSDVYIVDGILLLANEKLRKMSDLSIYLDTSSDVCFIRRLQRDQESRGRTSSQIISQYQATVKPMFQQFVEPFKKYAHFTVCHTEQNNKINNIIEMIVYWVYLHNYN